MRLSRKALAIAVLIALLALIALGSQSRLAQNAYYAWQFERTFDHYDQTDQTPGVLTNTTLINGQEAALLSAFFGVDNGLPRLAGLVICEGAGGLDGMPIIFNDEVDVTTLEPGDITVTRASGERANVHCLTMAPADDVGELRTALLVGEFGSPDDPPVRVEITGNVLSIDGSANFRGASVDVTPLEDGPSLVWAEIVPEDQWTLGQEASGIPFGGGSGCPALTSQVIRVTWAGGVTKPDTTPADDKERDLYEVTVVDADGNEAVITPMALADTGDGDNNHKLCLDTELLPVSVAFPAGYLTDPRDDLNPATSVPIQAPTKKAAPE